MELEDTCVTICWLAAQADMGLEQLTGTSQVCSVQEPVQAHAATAFPLLSHRLSLHLSHQEPALIEDGPRQASQLAGSWQHCPQCILHTPEAAEDLTSLHNHWASKDDLWLSTGVAGSKIMPC